MSNDLIREAKPGESGLVVHFYYHLFAKQFRFYSSTEQYFMCAMLDLFGTPEGNRLFVIEKEGQILGSMCVVQLSAHKAQLRMFAVSPLLQGQGYGLKLMQTAMDFCKARGYTDIILWTADICKTARKIYGKFGFQLTETKPNTDWADYLITEEKWDYHPVQ